MIALVASVLGASLLGSPHCAAMCGGFACFVAGQRDGRRGLAPLAYHAGRLVSYVALGAIAGLLGTGLDRAGAARGVGHVAAIVSGVVLLGWGVVALAEAVGARWPRPRLASHRPIAAVLRRVAGWRPEARALVLGLVTTLLPCGWLYLFVATAGGTGSPWRGALVMAAFWIGTLPMLVSLGAVARGAFGPLARRMPLVSASILIALGALTLAGKLQPHAHAGHTHAHVVEAAAADALEHRHGGD